MWKSKSKGTYITKKVHENEGPSPHYCKTTKFGSEVFLKEDIFILQNIWMNGAITTIT